MVDQNGLKTGQATTIILLLVGFVLGSWQIVVFVALAQLFGAFALPFAPYRLLYRGIRQVGLMQPNPQPDNPEPHRFAMLVGALFNGVGATLMLLGLPIVGWALVWVVIALANLNFWANFCLGCWMYYRFNRLGVPGFTVSPIGE